MKTILHNNRKGFTIIESVMATVVLMVAAAGVLMPFAGGAAMRAEGHDRTLAVKLAADLIEKIKLEDFNNIVAAWDGYAESQGRVKDFAGAVYADSAYSRFSRSVSCEYMSIEAGSGMTDLIKITVRVYCQGGKLAELYALKSR